jgi:hypothetical protein
MSDDTLSEEVEVARMMPYTNGIVRMHLKGYTPHYIAYVLEVDVEDVESVVKDVEDAYSHRLVTDKTVFDPKILHDFLEYLDSNRYTLNLPEDMFDHVIEPFPGKTRNSDACYLDTYKLLVDGYLRLRCERKS